VATEEIFGPVISIMRVDTLDEALAIENASPYGNAASVFYAKRGCGPVPVIDHASAGMIGVNVGVPVPREPFSFGGWNESKFGVVRYHRQELHRILDQTEKKHCQVESGGRCQLDELAKHPRGNPGAIPGPASQRSRQKNTMSETNTISEAQEILQDSLDYTPFLLEQTKRASPLLP